ncbi:Uncharacterised protein [Mycobacteroides abscessus subsp. abscessus]|nr:Uncharacterised protein [Mycobacteroides abscessus subsp. abscessus]
MAYQLSDDQLDALEAGDGKLTLTITDLAGNSSRQTIQAVAGEYLPEVDTTPTPQVRWSIPMFMVTDSEWMAIMKSEPKMTSTRFK